MGDIGTDTEYLPVKNDINASFAFAFNIMEGYYESSLTYKEIHHRRNTPEDSISKPNYNLTASFSLQCDRQAYTKDFARFDSLRPTPLDNSELYIYKRYKARMDSMKYIQKETTQPFKKNIWGSVGDFFLTDSDWKLSNNATLQNSPFINPLMFSYSKTTGIAYRQDLKFNTTFSNHLEITNGLSVGLGFMFHRRTPAEHPEESFRQVELPENVAEGLQANIRPQYNSFAPRIRVEWTPGQYYYMNGRQKINLKSRFPTFIVDYERGLRNIFKSTGVYERIEFDMQHHIRTGLLSNLYYRIGMGLFTNQEETYFVDFVNFRKSNLPEGWNDEIGGVFQALNGRWYNASPYYVRGHISYEAPFLVLRHLIKYTNHIQNERLYLNMLTMDHLGPYFELGYGIGTFVFDMGLFLSLENFKQIGFGYKITFELFSK